MEADWSVAMAAGDPVIAVPWAACGADARVCRFVDLRPGRHLIDEIEEARTRPALGSALLQLNSAESPLWTAKCGAWTSSAEEGAEPIDAYEMDAAPEETAFGAGSYIDLLPRSPAFLTSFERQERWMRVTVGTLRTLPAKAARVELILRRAEVSGVMGFGITWFAEGCGRTGDGAAQSWATALHVVLPVLIGACVM